MNKVEDLCCAICLDNIDISMNVIKTECKHCFHSNCFLQNAAHNGFNCPMCRNELASVPEDEDDDDDSEDSDDSEDEEDEEDFTLRGARWLMMRAEGEEIDEDDTDDESTSSFDDDYEFIRYEDESVPNTSIADIAQKMIASGITYEQLLAMYILPHHGNAADLLTYDKTFIKKTEQIVLGITNEQPDELCTAHSESIEPDELCTV